MSIPGENDRFLAEGKDAYEAQDAAQILFWCGPPNMTPKKRDKFLSQQKIYLKINQSGPVLDHSFYLYQKVWCENNDNPFKEYEKFGIFYHIDKVSKKTWYTFEANGEVLATDSSLDELCKIRLRHLSNKADEILNKY